MGSDCFKSTVPPQNGNDRLLSPKSQQRGKQSSCIGEAYLQQLETQRNKMIRERESRNESDNKKLQSLKSKLEEYKINGKGEKNYLFEIRKKNS